MDLKYPKCAIVIPTVYDDSLSYYEAVCKLYKSFNDLVNSVNTTLDEFENTAKEYTDEKVAEAFAEINRQSEQLKSDYRNFENLINSQIQLINAKITQQDTNITAGLNAINANVDLKIALNNDYIFKRIADEKLDIKVVNYFTGQLVSIQSMFDYLAQFHLENAITYAQLATREKTYNQLIALNITYTELSLNGAGLIN